MACSCKNKRKRSKVGAMSATDLDFKRIALLGGGAIASAMSNNLAQKIFKPKADAKKDANNGMLWGGIKAVAGGYFLATSNDETVQDLALGWTAESVLEVAMYAFKVPIAAYPNAIKGVGVGSSDPNIYLPRAAFDPQMPGTFVNVAGFQEAADNHRVAGSGGVL